MHYLRLTHLVLSIFFSISLTACGGGSVDSNKTEPKINPTGQYDLVDYLFNESLSVTLNSVSYPVTIYNKLDGTQIIQYTDSFDKILDNTILWKSNETPASTYVLTATTIDETVHSANDEFRVSQRFVDIGTEYMNDTSENLFGTQNASCKLVKHHPSVDLSKLTSTFSLATGLYNDVLEINCVTGFVIQGTILPHTTLTHYFARNSGLVFTEGEILLFGKVYIIPQL